jgi:DNA-binding response OmpR family regulator
MNILIVESDPDLSSIWRRHLERLGAVVQSAAHHDTAIEILEAGDIDAIVLDLELDSGGALIVADYASYRHAGARIVFVTRRTFFSDGSLFRLFPSAAAFVPAQVPPDDLAAIVEHHASPH